MQIAVIGAGYVGIVTGACLADTGHAVTCLDIDEAKLAKLRAGNVPFYEPGLEEIVQRTLAEGRLAFTTDVRDIAGAAVLFLAVGTPALPDGSADLSAVFVATSRIAEVQHRAQGDALIAIRSTVPPGTAEKVEQLVRQKQAVHVDVVSNPEFLREGRAVEDFLRPDRVVIGTESPRASEVMKELYEPFVRTGNPILIMDRRSAEMTKYAANLMLAARVSLMNEIANMCEYAGADVEQVRHGISLDARIGKAYLFPGPGYGGSCLPKDVKALTQMARQQGSVMRTAEAVHAANEEQKKIVVRKLNKHFGNLKQKRVAVWGLAFKPLTDDMREAPSLAIIEQLLTAGAEVTAHDPKANGAAYAVFGSKIRYADDAYGALDGADALILVTEWNEFRSPDFVRIKKLMRSPVILDARNIYDPQRLRKLGFTYYGLGRP